MTARRLLRRPAGPAATAGGADMPGPPAVEVAARHVRVGDDYAATLAVTGYPAEVAAGWLEPLLTYPGRLDVTLHIEPIPAAVAAARLRRQRARLESGRRAGASRGQLDDPDTEAAADDARELAWCRRTDRCAGPGTGKRAEVAACRMVTQRDSWESAGLIG
jgi:hypothetical protein